MVLIMEKLQPAPLVQGKAPTYVEHETLSRGSLKISVMIFLQYEASGSWDEATWNRSLVGALYDLSQDGLFALSFYRVHSSFETAEYMFLQL